MKRLIITVMLTLSVIAFRPVRTRARAGVVGPPRFSPVAPLRWELPPPPEPLWTARFGAFDDQWPYAGDDIPSTILADAGANAYVTGEGGFPPGSVDLNFMTIKYDSLGTRNWVVSEASEQNRIFYDIACDGTGHVYGAGEGWGGQLQGCLIRYDAGGNKLWENHHNPRWQGASFAHLALDPDGNACVTGWRESPVSGDNNLAWITIEYDPVGNQLWQQTFNQDSTSQSSDQGIPSGIAVSPTGNVYVTGNSASMIMTVRYSRQGTPVWVRQHPGGSGLGMGSNAITLDSYGNIYIAGGSSSDYVVIKYNPAGDELWAVTYDSGGGVSDYATGVATWGSRLFVTGTAGYPLSGYRDYLTIRYR